MLRFVYICVDKQKYMNTKIIHPAQICGKKFTRLTITKFHCFRERKSKDGKIKKDPFYECVCDCGNVRIVNYYNLTKTKETTKSCGCLSSEELGKRSKKHGYNGTPIFKVWCSMIERCYTSTHKEYHRYGGRGISVCDKWRESFLEFLNDMGDRPNSLHSIDRINNDLNYCKENCRWATKKEQIRNRRNTVLVKIGQETKPLIEWCERYDLPYSKLYVKIRKYKKQKDEIGASKILFAALNGNY